jgi:hypothetical protein
MPVELRAVIEVRYPQCPGRGEKGEPGSAIAFAGTAITAFVRVRAALPGAHRSASHEFDMDGQHYTEKCAGRGCPLQIANEVLYTVLAMTKNSGGT